MIKIFIHHEKGKEEATAIQYAEKIRKNPDITVVFVRVLHVPEQIGISVCHENGMGSALTGMRKRLMVVVDYVGNCPRCDKVQYASEALADELCQDCRMEILRKKEGHIQ
ncbi:MAG: hypothetical protein KAJ03_00255 [Gammaproteobacteria bacterium]|nr:hypothetical protein [Gammaproteobacteria bacterium]